MSQAPKDHQDTKDRVALIAAVPVGGEGGTGVLRHLFGPAFLVGVLSIAFALTACLLPPHHRTQDEKYIQRVRIDLSGKPDQVLLRSLLDYQLKDYRANLAKFDASITLQGLLVLITVLLMIRRSDSLNLFGNSIPLSWLHFFVPVVMLYLWLSFGFLLHDLISTRIRGVELIKALNHPIVENQRNTLLEHQKAMFRDSGFMDGWFIRFIDPAGGKNSYSGISHTFSPSTVFFLVIGLGTLVSAAHASMLAIVPVACRRYLRTKSNRWLSWYYVLPALLAMFLIMSHVQFAYGGPNRNWVQLYIAVATIPLMAFLLWLSVVIDSATSPDSVSRLRRQHLLVYPRTSMRSAFVYKLRPTEAGGRTVSLIGDSLSTSFHVASPLAMILRMRRTWKRNWFLDLPCEQGVTPSVLERLSGLGAITGVHHASVSARVDEGGRRSVTNKMLDTWNFSHQVDEVLAGEFPDLLLIWIGHNNVNWVAKTNVRTLESFEKLAEEFVALYEVQLRRLLTGALASSKRAVILVFGLVNFASFFEARTEAGVRRATDRKLYPHLESGQRYFSSMKPENQEGMVDLARLYNQRLEVLCHTLGKELAGTSTEVFYSNAMSAARFPSADLLSRIDAWHPSRYGHAVLADSAYPAVYEQAPFLGWTRNPGATSKT